MARGVKEDKYPLEEQGVFELLRNLMLGAGIDKDKAASIEAFLRDPERNQFSRKQLDSWKVVRDVLDGHTSLKKEAKRLGLSEEQFRQRLHVSRRMATEIISTNLLQLSLLFQQSVAKAFKIIDLDPENVPPGVVSAQSNLIRTVWNAIGADGKTMPTEAAGRSVEALIKDVKAKFKADEIQEVLEQGAGSELLDDAGPDSETQVQ